MAAGYPRTTPPRAVREGRRVPGRSDDPRLGRQGPRGLRPQARRLERADREDLARVVDATGRGTYAVLEIRVFDFGFTSAT